MYNLRSHLLRINLMTPIHFLTFLLLVYTLPSISLPNQIPRLAIFIVIFVYIFQFLAHNIRLFSIHSSIFRHNFYSCQVGRTVNNRTYYFFAVFLYHFSSEPAGISNFPARYVNIYYRQTNLLIVWT